MTITMKLYDIVKDTNIIKIITNGKIDSIFCVPAYENLIQVVIYEQGKSEPEIYEYVTELSILKDEK